MTIAGDTVDIITFEKPVFINKSQLPNYSKPVGRTKQANETNRTKNRDTTLKRSRKHVKELINANYKQWYDDDGKLLLPVFMTLTYKENMTDIPRGKKDFQKFIQRLNYHLHKGKSNKLKYIAVPEFQVRGALHYHSIFFNLTFVPIETLKEKWKHGSVDVALIHDDERDRIASYLIKTMKLEYDDERLHGMKCYLASQGLRKAKVTTNKREIESMRKTLSDNKLLERDFGDTHYGNIKYEQYRKKR